jgi:putative ABC transport system permease protein
LLICLGLVATALATSSALVAADSLATLFEADAEAQWGTTDILVFSPGEAVMDESMARFVGVEGGDLSDGWAERLILDGVADFEGKQEPATQVLGLSADEQDLTSPLTGAGHLDPLTLEADEVIVNERLTERLGLAIGDELGLVISSPEWVEELGGERELTHDPATYEWRPVVAGIAEDRSAADFARTPNVITRMDSLQRVAEMPGKASALYVSSPEPGRDAAEDVIEEFEEINRGVGLVAIPVKEDALDIARDEGGLFRGILITLALLVVAASAAVTMNLIVLLGEERSREIAVLSALGARRDAIRRLFVWEASVYAAIAAVVGTLAALPFADALAGLIADHFADINAGRGQEQVSLVLDARPLTITAGIAIVLAIALLTARAASRRIANLDVEATLRGSPPALPPAPNSPRRVARTTTAGLLVLGMGITAPDAADLLRFTGLSLLLAAWWLRLRQRTETGPQRDRLDTRAAVIGLIWCIVAPALLGDFGKGLQSSFGLIALAGVGAVVCATVLAGERMRQIMRVARIYVPGYRAQAPLRTAGAFAEAGRARTGTAIGCIAIVLFMVAALNVLGNATDVSVARQSGGYDMIGTSPVAVDEASLQGVRGVDHVTTMSHTVMGESWYRTRDDDGNVGSVPYPVRAVELAPDFISEQSFALVDALPEYDDVREMLDAALSGDGVVVDRYSRPEGADPGDDVVIDDGRGPRTFELLGVVDTFVLNSVMFGPTQYGELFRSQGPTFVLGVAGTGTTADDAADELSMAGSRSGLDAVSMDEAAADVTEINRTFTDVFAVLLEVGLAVALIGLGVFVARSMRERRASLAVLRAVGFRRRQVALTLLAEPLLETIVGAAIGLGVGLSVLWLLFRTGFNDLAFVVGWSRLGLTIAAVLLLVTLVCYGPASIGARRDPAEALHDLG